MKSKVDFINENTTRALMKLFIPLMLAMGRLCVPTSIQSIMPALSSAVMITFVNPFGLTALAGYGVVRNLELIMFMPTNAMSMAVTSIVGQCKGAGRIDRAGDYCKKAMLTG